MKKPRMIPVIFYIILIVGLIMLLINLFGSADDLIYSQVVEQFMTGNVREFLINGDEITLYLHEAIEGKDVVKATLADPEGFMTQMQSVILMQQEEGILQAYEFKPVPTLSPYDFILPIVLAGLVLIIVWAFIAGRANNNNPMANFGKARTIQGQQGKKITFADVAGMEEEKRELQEVVDFLKDPEKFRKVGAKIPHGILLSGPPGTGKTMLAKAAAGEAGVQFLSISGSDFMEMYVGVGASRVRDLFDQARRMMPSIIFIDEIDAVGRKRGAGLGGGHDEREQTLNQLLVEMDGFTKEEGVVVLAATNRSDILDPALLRPGRFDRQIYVGRPDSSEREAILKIHAKDKCLDGSVDLHTLALSTAGFTGADLSNLLNEAAILAARDNRPALNMDDVEEAMMKVLAGPEKRSRVRLKKDLYLTAVHEAGHAVAMYRLPTHDPVRQISIIPRGRALGLTWTQPDEESMHLTRNEMYEQIVGLLGGRVAEQLFLQDISTGASNDIERATKLARDMVTRYGMCEALGTVSYADGQELFIGRDFERTKGYSEKVAGTIDDEVHALIRKAFDHCAKILKENEQKLRQVVSYLMEHETMSGEDFAACMEEQKVQEA